MKSILKSKLFISLILLVTAGAAAAVIAVSVSHSGNDLQTKLDLGKKYVSELDYENAIIAYEEALEIDPYCLDAYLGLSDAYMALGQPDKAAEVLQQAKNMLPESVEVYAGLARLYASQNQIDLAVSVLEEGIAVTDSDQLREMLREYRPEPSADSGAENVSVAEPEEREEEDTEEEDTEEEDEPSIAIGLQPDTREQTAAPVLVIDQNREEPVEIPLVVQPTLQVPTGNVGDASGDTGEESESSGGNSGSGSGGSGSGSVEEPAPPRTGINGNVYDINGQVIEGVTVNIYASGAQTPLTTSTNEVGSYLQELTSGTYRVVLSKEGYVDISTTLLVAANALTSNSYIMLTTEESRQSASFKGIVISALDSQNIEGVTIALLNGFDQASNGDPNVIADASHTTTGADGRFSISDGVNAGYYTVEASRDGYSTYHHNETLKPGENEFTINMSPVIQTQGEYRIVLTWGEHPRDLDSHLFCSGNANYHVYFGNKESNDGSAFLDWDDTTSYGPETTTVRIGEGNSYIYAIHNFTDKGTSPGESAAWNLAASGARVVVYGGEGIIFDGNVPVNQQGTIWEVFRIENGRLTVTNTMGFEYASTSAASDAPATIASVEEEVPAAEEGTETNVLNENAVQTLQAVPALSENARTEETVSEENAAEESLESDDETDPEEPAEEVNTEAGGADSEEPVVTEEESQQDNDEEISGTGEMPETGETAESEDYIKPEDVSEDATENESLSDMEEADGDEEQEETSEEITEETDGQQ